MQVGAGFLIAALGGALSAVDRRADHPDPEADHPAGLRHGDLVHGALAGVRARRGTGSRRLPRVGVIAVVTAGLLLGHRSPVIQSGQSRLAERVNWQTIQFLLENTVFLLIGLQTSGCSPRVGLGRVRRADHRLLRWPCSSA